MSVAHETQCLIDFTINNIVNSKEMYMFSKKSGVYSVVINNTDLSTDIINRLCEKVNKQKNEIISLALADYVLMDPGKQTVLLVKDLEDNVKTKKEYLLGVKFEFDCMLGNSSYIFSRDYGKKYWLYFLAGFIDSNKSYTIRVEEFNTGNLLTLLSILNYLGFKYKDKYIESRYIHILTKNPFCITSSA